MSSYETQEKKDQHKAKCNGLSAVIYVPHSDAILKWVKLYQKMPIYLTIYGDFECRKEPTEIIDTIMKTVNLTHHKPCCNGCFVVIHFKNLSLLLEPGYYDAHGGRNL